MTDRRLRAAVDTGDARRRRRREPARRRVSSSWRATTSTCCSSAARRTRARSPTRRACGSPERVRSRRDASSSAGRPRCTCSRTPTRSSHRLSRRTPLRAHLESRASCSPRSTRSTACATRAPCGRRRHVADGERAPRAGHARSGDRRRGTDLRRALGQFPTGRRSTGVEPRRDRGARRARRRWSPRCSPGVTPAELRGVCAAAVRVPRNRRRPRSKPSPRPLDGGGVDLVAAGARARRRRTRRAARRRAARRLGSVPRPHLRRRDAGRSNNPRPRAGTTLVAACVAGTTVGALRARAAVVHGVGHGVEPWPDELVLVPDLVVRDRAPRRARLCARTSSASPTRSAAYVDSPG